MSIGYACLNIGTPNTNIRSVMQRNATPEKLTEVTAHNLEALEKMIDYKRNNNINLFHVNSNLILFGSSPAAMTGQEAQAPVLQETKGGATIVAFRGDLDKALASFIIAERSMERMFDIMLPTRKGT